MSADLLRAIPFLADLGEDDLATVASQTAHCSLPAGGTLFEEGEPGAHAYVITSGEVEILKRSEGREVLLAVRRPGDVIGEMALLEDAPRMATVRARTDSTFLSIPREVFDRLLGTSIEATHALFGALLARWRETEARMRQREQLAQLGTLSAGLAHELNNPAAAARRAASSLADASDALADAAAAFYPFTGPLTNGLVDRIVNAAPHRLGSLARADRQEEIESRLAGSGLASSSRAAALADLDPPTIDEVLEGLATLDAGAGAATLALGLCRREVRDLASAALQAATRISDIVGAVKAYAFTGQAPAQEVQIESLLDDTLTLMGHKLGDIRVNRDYGGLPPLQARGSELNQVWTNLVDNAIDAITEAGRVPGHLTIRTFEEGGRVVVEIEDDGTGVPPEVLPRMFDSFYTTKPPGSGTGLGLDIAFGIVVQGHGGDITVDSQPGRTVVRVELPVGGIA
ncbi:MAG: cyclic nucleotide-binding domain-containing protein [Actinobacteria bacterium]|nr:cyclic nucleotide-binding domain-containing protein [Actinomycetota bacterium]